MKKIYIVLAFGIPYLLAGAQTSTYKNDPEAKKFWIGECQIQNL